MAISFNHKPSGSIIGSGSYVFRHYGSEEICVLLNEFTIPSTTTSLSNITGPTCSTIPSLAKSKYTYTGGSISPNVLNYIPEIMSKSGDVSAVDKGSYTLNVNLLNGKTFTDSTTSKSLNWIITDPVSKTITISGTGSSTYAYCTIDGTQYTAAASVTTTSDAIDLYIGAAWFSKEIKVNGVVVQTVAGTYTLDISEYTTVSVSFTNATYRYAQIAVIAS